MDHDRTNCVVKVSVPGVRFKANTECALKPRSVPGLSAKFSLHQRSDLTSQGSQHAHAHADAHTRTQLHKEHNVLSIVFCSESLFFPLSLSLNLIISAFIHISPPFHCSAGVLTATNDKVWAPQSPQPASLGHICSISSPEHFHMETCHHARTLHKHSSSSCSRRWRRTETDRLTMREQTVRESEQGRWTERGKNRKGWRSMERNAEGEWVKEQPIKTQTGSVRWKKNTYCTRSTFSLSAVDLYRQNQS